MIQLEHVSFHYPKRNEMVIKDLNLKINKNEKVTIIGKSGCGKTTLLYLLGAILKPTEGKILIDQVPLTKYRASTGIIFQQGGLFPWKTVRKNLELGLKIRGIDKEERKEKMEQISNELGIQDYQNRYIKELSGGQKQRVAIARSLVLDSDLLLLDEPSSSLDAMTKEQFQNTLLETFKRHDMTSILVTHDIFEAVYLGQKIIIMKDGKIAHLIENDLFGKEENKKSLAFYERCIKIKEMLEA
jgi:NitT/TauT family transport system ATP-binding protein